MVIEPVLQAADVLFSSGRPGLELDVVVYVSVYQYQRAVLVSTEYRYHLSAREADCIPRVSDEPPISAPRVPVAYLVATSHC
jgi:hypothetical protein